MKELSIEEKATAYYEIRKKIAIRFGSNVADEIFSEFEISEDERIRKELVAFLKETIEYDGISPDIWTMNNSKKWIAWLEKQKDMEAKLIISDEGYSKAFQNGIEEALTNPHKYGLEKQGKKEEEILILKDQIESLHAAIKALKQAHKMELEKQASARLVWSEEDEKIGKEILAFIKRKKSLGSVNPEDLGKSNFWIDWLEKQGEKTSDKIVEKARKEKQRVLLTETDGSANIDWDCRSLDDVKILLKCGLEFIRTVEANKQILTDTRFGGCSIRVPTRYDKEIKQGEQKSADKEPKFKVGDIITPKDRGHEPWQIMQVDILDKKYRFKDGYVIHFSQEDNYELAEQKPTDKVELKFKVGDIITNGEIIGKIDENKNNKYHGWFGYDKNMCVHYSDIPDIEDWHLWDIQDAKDGDVLIHNKISFIFMGIENGIVKGICAELSDTILNFGEPEYDNDYLPATKEQRDTLMKAMTDAGYTFDFEKKELKKIKQKPAWSEEDERIYQSIMDDTVQENQLDGKQIDWLRDIKYRHFSQSQQEWSEEDETRLTNTIIMLKEGASLHFNKKDITKTVDWLKTLKERCTWKPSDEQMEALDNFIYAKYPNIEKYEAAVKSLYQDLKKLREE